MRRPVYRTPQPPCWRSEQWHVALFLRAFLPYSVRRRKLADVTGKLVEPIVRSRGCEKPPGKQPFLGRRPFKLAPRRPLSIMKGGRDARSQAASGRKVLLM